MTPFESGGAREEGAGTEESAGWPNMPEFQKTSGNRTVERDAHGCRTCAGSGFFLFAHVAFASLWFLHAAGVKAPALLAES